jgi:formylglycine-generating enzyme required for sulfatase activity
LPSGAAGPQLALIPAGTFEMGGDATSERPVHVVTIRAPLAISVQEVSQAEFKQYCDATGAACAQQPWSGDDYPVVNVSWRDAQGYVDWLSRVTGHRYGLPSEAQWEYAARAGQRTPTPAGNALSPTDAHFSMLTKQPSPAPRRQKFNQNAFRLQHTLGNVREWVEDPWSADYTAAPSDGSATRAASGDMRVVRGGSYADGAAALRFSARESLKENTRDAWTGFRVMREVP